TVWPGFWDRLTVQPDPSRPDPYAQARVLLDGTMVTVPRIFTSREVDALKQNGTDLRLKHAAEHAEHGRITQYLAGAPELEARYRAACPAAQALIQIAMDARRLGHPLALSETLLKEAADGYLDDHDWDALDD